MLPSPLEIQRRRTKLRMIIVITFLDKTCEDTRYAIGKSVGHSGSKWVQ